MRAGQSPDYLNELQLAERLGVTRRVVEEMMRRRMIPYLALGHRTVRFFWPAVERALANSSIGPWARRGDDTG